MSLIYRSNKTKLENRLVVYICLNGYFYNNSKLCLLLASSTQVLLLWGLKIQKIQRKDLSNITTRIKAITTLFFPKMLFSYLAYSWPSSKWFKYFGGIIQLLVRKTKNIFFLYNAWLSGVNGRKRNLAALSLKVLPFLIAILIILLKIDFLNIEKKSRTYKNCLNSLYFPGLGVLVLSCTCAKMAGSTACWPL